MYHVTAQNFSDANENKIHNDDIAKRYGFRGALVPGVAVWGHVTHPFVERDGAEWLRSAHVSVRFHKPAYHDDELTIVLAPDNESEDVDERAQCHNSRGEFLAEITSPPDARNRFLPESGDELFENAPTKPSARVDMVWDTVVPGQRFAAWTLELDAAENARYCDEIRDALSVYSQDHVVHPHWLLSIANDCLTREYVMPAWIHVGSEVRCHQLLEVGDVVDVHTIVQDRWERKGHQFLRTYTRYERGGELTTEISHTAIFRVAE